MKNRFKPRSLRREGGWLLLQLAFTMVLLSILATADLKKQFRQMMDLKANAVATGVEVIAKVGDDYLNSYGSQIKVGQPIDIPGGGVVVSSLTPTIAELLALGKTPPGATGRSLLVGGEYKLFISGKPAGCTLADSNCSLEGLACIDKPLLNGRLVDYPRLGLALRKIGANGAYSSVENPAIMAGSGGSWSATNPIVNTPGILCARFGSSSPELAAFIRKDGTVAMTDNFNVGGNSIDNVFDINGTGKITGASFQTELKVVDTACTNVGAIASGNGYAMICGTDLKWHIDSGPRANEGAACTGVDQTAKSAATGEILVCNRSGTYTRLSSLISRKVLISSGVVRDGTVLSKPACGVGGIPDYSFEATQITIDVANTPPKQTMLWSAESLGSSWQVKIRLRDNFGNEVSGNTVDLTNIIKLECTY